MKNPTFPVGNMPADRRLNLPKHLSPWDLVAPSLNIVQGRTFISPCEDYSLFVARDEFGCLWFVEEDLLYALDVGEALWPRLRLEIPNKWRRVAYHQEDDHDPVNTVRFVNEAGMAEYAAIVPDESRRDFYDWVYDGGVLERMRG